jgi:HEAT repeat protein
MLEQPLRHPTRSARHQAPFAAALALLALAPSLAAQGKGDKRLEEATRELRKPGEADVRNGAQLCAAIDTPASMELLLKVLDSDQPHRRDIVWEALPSFRSAEARERVAQELAKNKKNELTRQWCAQLLGLYADASALEPLEKSLGDKTPEVRAAAAQALGRIGDAGAVEALAKLADDKEYAVRAYAREALATLDPAGQGDALRGGLADEEAGVRCFLLGCVPEVLPDETAALSTAALADADWRVRLQAVENLGLVRTRESVEALIGIAADPRPVVAHAVRASLAKLTGQGWNKPEQWKLWWQGERDAFDPAVPPPPKPAVADEERTVTVRYNDLPVESDHVAFLIDVSSEMKSRLKSVKSTKSEAAYAELERVLGLLDGRLVFNVYAYDTLAPAFVEGPVALDAKSARKALAFVADAHPRGAKDIWNALLTALGDSELDTLYLLASGEPEIGLYVHHNRVTEHLRELQRFHKVVVHGVAYTDSKWYADQIEEICKATGGEFRRVE